MKRKIIATVLLIIAVLAVLNLAAHIWISIKPDTSTGYARRYTFCAAAGIKARFPSDTSSLAETYHFVDSAAAVEFSELEKEAIKRLMKSKDTAAVRLSKLIKKGKAEAKIKFSGCKTYYTYDYFGNVYASKIRFYEGPLGVLGRRKSVIAKELRKEINIARNPYKELHRSYVDINKAFYRIDTTPFAFEGSVSFQDRVNAKKVQVEDRKDIDKLLVTADEWKKEMVKHTPLFEKPIVGRKFGNKWCLEIITDSGEVQTLYLVKVTALWRPYKKYCSFLDKNEGVFRSSQVADAFAKSIFEKSFDFHCLEVSPLNTNHKKYSIY